MKVVLKNNCEPYNPRFVITDDEGKIVDDAQGYGYKTKQNAYKAMNYKFQGGKQKKQQKDSIRKTFFKQHPGLEKFIDSVYEMNCKEIFRGEVSEEDIKQEIKDKFGIDIPSKYLTD
jgi:hypothetical protein